MKNQQNKENYHSNRNENNSSFLRLLRRFYSIIGDSNFDVFQYLKVEQEKLQIIYANIRV
ncbi:MULTISPECIES: hypothetical protein [unclassified Flavobacterium]|jgi:hypothetical protein|uniref:hypothetical protein n=1 Tax=unclassified Flavobacterium TaxID=196869 RepID=UPI003F919B8A